MKTIRRRRKANVTNYSIRLKLLKGDYPRIVFRKSNKYIIGQYVTSKEAQDTVKIHVVSKDLIKYGWPEKLNGSLKSIPAAYLTGYLLGKKIKKQKATKKPILDIGMNRNIHGSKIYGFLKGAVDSGAGLEYKKDVLPSVERLEGKNLKEDFSSIIKTIKSKIDTENDGKN